MSGAMILTGAPGSGKSSVLDALSTLLEIDGIRFGAIETEQLARGWPWLTPREWIPQLAAVISAQRRAGRDTFLVVATTETEAELEAVIEAVGVNQPVVICLSVPPDLAACRVSEREPDAWPGKRALIEHARKLAGDIPSLPRIDIVLHTAERRAVEVAAEVRDILLGTGLIEPGRLFHIARRRDWEQAQDAGSYSVSTLGKQLADEGFIHLSFAHQVKPVADFVYRGMSDLVLLEVDPSLLDAPVVVEPAPDASGQFPHLYGPLRIQAVVNTIPYRPNPDGTFEPVG